MVNSSLIFSVRRQLNDVPEDYLSDEAIYQALRQADAYLEKVLDPNVDAAYREHCLVVLGAYFAYSIYVASVERGLGAVPATSEERLMSLRKLAATLIRPVARYPVRDDLTIDIGTLSDYRPVVARLSESELNG